MPRQNRILLEQRERIIRAFADTNEDYLMVADTIGVNRSTSRSIVARYIREGRIAERPRGGANNVRVDNEMNTVACRGHTVTHFWEDMLMSYLCN